MSSLYPFQNIINEAEKVPITILGIGIEDTFSSTLLFCFGNSSTTFRKVGVISCKHYQCGWIYITVFLCDLLLGFHSLIFYNTEAWKNIV